MSFDRDETLDRFSKSFEFCGNLYDGSQDWDISRYREGYSSLLLFAMAGDIQLLAPGKMILE